MYPMCVLKDPVLLRDESVPLSHVRLLLVLCSGCHGDSWLYLQVH